MRSFSFRRNSTGLIQRTFSRPQEKYKDPFLRNFFTGLNRTCPMVELVPLNMIDQEAKFLKSKGSKRRPSFDVNGSKSSGRCFFFFTDGSFWALTPTQFFEIFFSLFLQKCIASVRHCCVRSLIWKWESEPTQSLFRFFMCFMVVWLIVGL